jgi:hypothetical protein
VTLPEITAVERLTLRPGDRLIICVDQILVRHDQAEAIVGQVRRALRLDESVPVAVLPAGYSVQVLGPEEVP